MEAMDLQTFLMWASLINLAILIVASAAMAAIGPFAATMQGKIFRISEERVYFGTYLILGIYKMMILVFLLVPWIVVSILA